MNQGGRRVNCLTPFFNSPTGSVLFLVKKIFSYPLPPFKFDPFDGLGCTTVSEIKSYYKTTISASLYPLTTN